MADDDGPHGADLKVVTDGMRAQGGKWQKLSADMQPIATAVGDLYLTPSAFFVGDPNTFRHYNAYESFRTLMSDVFTSGVTELNQFGDALIRAANGYDAANEIATDNLNAIYQEPAPAGTASGRPAGAPPNFER